MLKLKSLITPSAMLTAFTLVAAPSFAQEREHGRQRSGQESSGRGAERAQPRSETPREQAPVPRAEPRQQAPPAETRQQAPRAESPQQAPRVESRRQDAPRFESRQQAEPSQAPSRRFENRRDEVVGRAVPRRDAIEPRGNYAPRHDPRYDSRYQPRYQPRSDSRYESHYNTPRYYSPGYYGSRSYYRPYVFRPRFSIGFGIFSGYAVPYSYSYGYPIDVYGYGAPRERVMITPGGSYYGGVALEITPYDADVYVDGEYAGRVEDFDGTTQPLTLTAGTHRVEVQAAGYESLTVDVGVQAGQVIPYRGDLRRY